MTRLKDWLAHLEALHPQGAAGIELGLGRVLQVKIALDQRQTVPVLTVGGTNGKGSTCAMLEAILLAAGWRVGLYTSPHLLRYNERIRIDGTSCQDAALCRAFERVEEARQRAGDIALTYFEFGTLAAWECFAAAGVDVVILEVGLGGRLDAVNCFDADCSVITTIDLDHCNYLGHSREAIGFEKAGIMRAGRPCVCADARPPQSLVDFAKQRSAELELIGRDFGIELLPDETHWRYWSSSARLDLPKPNLAGHHQLANAAATLRALEHLHERLPVSQAAIAQGLRAVRLVGRFDWRAGKLPLLLDVAHNPQAARVLAATLACTPCAGQTWAVFGMLGDKDIGGVIEAMQASVDRWLPCTLSAPRGASASELAGRLRQGGVEGRLFESASPAAALRAAQAGANESDRILVFGSFLTVADVLREIARKA